MNIEKEADEAFKSIITPNVVNNLDDAIGSLEQAQEHMTNMYVMLRPQNVNKFERQYAKLFHEVNVLIDKIVKIRDIGY